MRTARAMCVVGSLALAVGGCASNAKTEAKSDAAKAAAYELPAAAAPAPELLPLSFMVGRWVCVNPNKTVNDEHWTAPRGNHMASLFKQARRDGKPALVEVSLITVEADKSVKLTLRHLHAGLEVPENQKELSLFTLKSAANNRAEFAALGKAEGMSVVYRLDGADTMIVDVNFPEGSKEKPYSMTYHRER
ncbi:MAG: DUF6265 family protein [Planctomycetota bacterium]|nr:DUF6265 family protein [Planctomycetota bacterium]